MSIRERDLVLDTFIGRLTHEERVALHAGKAAHLFVTPEQADGLYQVVFLAKEMKDIDVVDHRGVLHKITAAVLSPWPTSVRLHAACPDWIRDATSMAKQEKQAFLAGRLQWGGRA